ncbi:MAG: tetratricopeptide repeat protein [Saprospiraceae bacterium]
MKNLLLLLLFLLSTPLAFDGISQQEGGKYTGLITKLDRISKDLELNSESTYKATHDLFSKFLEAKDSSSAAIVMSRLSSFYRKFNSFPRMIEATDSAILLLPQKPLPEVRFWVQLSKVETANSQGHAANSRRYVDTLGAILTGVDDTRKRLAYLIRVGYTCRLEKQFAAALDVIREADALVGVEGNPRWRESVHKLASAIYGAMGKIEKSDEQANLALAYIDKQKRPISAAVLIQFLAFNRTYNGDHKRALSILDSAEALLQGLNAPYKILQFKLNRGMIVGQLGDWEKANAIFLETLALCEESGTNPAQSLYWLGISYRGLEDYPTAIQYLKKSVDESLARKAMQEASNCARAISESYEWKDNHKPALEWYRKHIEFRDSVTTADFAMQQEIAEMKYEAFRTKQNSKQVLAKAQLVKRNNQLLASIVIGLSLTGLIAIYAFRQRQQSIKLKEIEAQRKAYEMNQKNLNLNQQLNVQALTLTQKNALLKSLESDLSGMRSGTNATNAQAISKLSRSIRNDRTESKDWEVFMSSLKEMHGDLFKALQQQHPNLTSNDHRILAMVKLNMSTKEMARALSVSDAGAKKARYRIRKKLNLNSSISLSSYLIKLEESQSV